MKNSDNKISRKVVIQATAILILVALVLVILGYIFLTFFYGYKFSDLISDIVGNLIGVLAAFLLFDILYNKLTQDAYAKETSQQITKTLMGEPEILDLFSEEDKKNFIKTTITSLVKDEDAVDMLITNMGKYFDGAKEARIRKAFDYTINLDPHLTSEYVDAKFPEVDKYYLIDEELKFNIKYLSEKDKNYTGDVVCIGFAYDKKSLDAGLLENGQDEDFSKCIFNEDLVINSKAVEYINSLPDNQVSEVISTLFMPILRIDNSEDGEDQDVLEVERKSNGIILKFKLDYDKMADEHDVSIYFKMPRLWDSIFEVTLVDPTKEPHIKMKYRAGMDVTMYSYLNKESQANTGACIRRAGLYDIAIKGEWIFPKSGVVFHIKKAK
ncbi:MAG: hypothetical protein PUE95_03155 [Lachnospiraceae bacterium]|nr:hypothetical protein [Lachnospiraceae bacterium]